MDTPLALDLASPEDLEARREAEKSGSPFLLLRDDERVQQIVPLDARSGSVTVGRRKEADVPLAWDPEVSRLHAELEYKAGDWTLCDDGFSQNGTFVNGLRIHGRRRLSDGDLVRIGQTSIAFCDPGLSGLGVTLAPGELGIAPKFSEQQQRILRAPLPAADGRRRGASAGRRRSDRGRDRNRGGGRDDRARPPGPVRSGCRTCRRRTGARRSRCSRCAPAWSRPTRTAESARVRPPRARPRAARRARRA